MLIMLNCHNYNHPERYGRFDAFFDLDEGAKEVDMLYSDAICCVLSYVDPHNRSGDIRIAYWRYCGKVKAKAKGLDFSAWCLFGIKIGETTVPKASLKNHPEFAGVVAADGDFNRFTIRTVPRPAGE